MAGRGQLTDEIIAKSVELMGYEIDVTEFRLIPYVHYEATNNQKLNPSCINFEERKILRKWKDKGWFDGGISGLAITKEFWDIMNELLWVGYVDYHER